MIPLVINIDSAFDWTTEVRHIWDQLNWDSIRQAVAPKTSVGQWISRSNKIGLIGLVSGLLIDKAYHFPGWEENRGRPEQRDNSFSREWRERQFRRGRRKGEGNNNFPRQSRRFDGEEPFFRSPRVGRAGVVECFGIYVDKAKTILDRRNLLDNVPPDVHDKPAIFLCPERLHDIYPTLLSLGEELHNPLLLSSNPALVTLHMTLLHELGHHFFPVHQSGVVQFLSEALANFFCFCGLNPNEQAWLLYKSWLLQPPEYSAYRPLSALCEADADCRSAVAKCFHGRLDSWSSLPPKKSCHIGRNLGASLTMGLACDAPACTGLWGELRLFVSKENQWFLPWDNNDVHFHLMRHDQGHIPSDLVLDLYRKKDLTQWLTNWDLPKDFWGGWGYGDEVKWPEDCFCISDDDIDKWIEIYEQTSSPWLASHIVLRKLIALKDAHRVVEYFTKVLTAPAHRPEHRHLNHTIEDLSLILKTYPDAVLGELWLKPLAEFVNGDPQYSESRGWDGVYSTIFALGLLKRIPGFRARPALNSALDQAGTLIIDSKADWRRRVQAIEFVELCEDRNAILMLEIAVGCSEGYAKPVREAASRALKSLRRS